MKRAGIEAAPALALPLTNPAGQQPGGKNGRFLTNRQTPWIKLSRSQCKSDLYRLQQQTLLVLSFYMLFFQ